MRYLGLNSFKRVYDVGIKIEDDLLKIKQHNAHDKEPLIKKDTLTNNEVYTIELRPYKTWVRSRTLTPIGMTYTQALEKLHTQKKLFPMRPTPHPPEDKRSLKYNIHAYCKYHRGNRHDTEQCWVLKHVIQDMIEEGKLSLPI